MNGQTKFIATNVEPNDNITIQYGPLTLTRMVFEMFEMDRVFSGMKRKQGATVSEVATALVAQSMTMQGLSINRMEDLIEDPDARRNSGLSEDVDKNDLYRTAAVLGKNSDEVIQHLDRMLKDKFGLNFDKVFMDWSATYVDGKTSKIVKFGYTKDHRPDRPQVSIGLSMDADTGIPIGLTVMPGNTVDVTHFKENFKQIRPYLDDDCLIVFDNGGYSDENAKMVTGNGMDFLTRAQFNISNDKTIADPRTEWEYVDDDICAFKFKGNLGYTKCIFFSVSRYSETVEGYRAKISRDYDEMEELKASIKNGKVRKKYRNGNVFVDTRLSYLFPIDVMSREDAMEEAYKRRITGREGYFILMSSRDMPASEMLSLYRSRNDIEDAYRDLKHGIDIRPLRCRDEMSIRGRILISFLAYFALAFAKFLVPEARDKTAETLVEELKRFSLTVVREKGIEKQRIHSNFGPIMRSILDAFPTFSGCIPRGFRLGNLPSHNPAGN